MRAGSWHTAAGGWAAAAKWEGIPVSVQFTCRPRWEVMTPSFQALCLSLSACQLWTCYVVSPDPMYELVVKFSGKNNFWPHAFAFFDIYYNSFLLTTSCEFCEFGFLRQFLQHFYSTVYVHIFFMLILFCLGTSETICNQGSRDVNEQNVIDIQKQWIYCCVFFKFIVPSVMNWSLFVLKADHGTTEKKKSDRRKTCLALALKPFSPQNHLWCGHLIK